MGSPVDGRPVGRLLLGSVVLLLLGAIGIALSSSPQTDKVDTMTSSTPSTKPAAPVLTPNGLDGLTIGLTWSEVAPRSPQIISDTPSCRVAIDRLTGATAVFVADELLIVTVQTPGITTREGIGVGMAYDARDRQRVVATDGGNELVVGQHEGKVTYLWARRIGASIGC